MRSGLKPAKKLRSGGFLRVAGFCEDFIPLATGTVVRDKGSAFC